MEGGKLASMLSRSRKRSRVAEEQGREGAKAKAKCGGPRSSQYRGVSKSQKKGKKWSVTVYNRQKVATAPVGKCIVHPSKKRLGYFDDEIAAARAYDAFVIAQKLNKPLNFPDTAAAKGHAVASTKSRFRGVCWEKRWKKW